MLAIRAGILGQYMGSRNRVGIGLSYRPARLHRLVESIPGLLKSLQIPSLVKPYYLQATVDLVGPRDRIQIFLQKMDSSWSK